jgi:hypothetical protein
LSAHRCLEAASRQGKVGNCLEVIHHWFKHALSIFLKLSIRLKTFQKFRSESFFPGARCVISEINFPKVQVCERNFGIRSMTLQISINFCESFMRCTFLRCIICEINFPKVYFGKFLETSTRSSFRRNFRIRPMA